MTIPTEIAPRLLTFDNRFVGELPGDPERSPRRRQVMGAMWSAVEPTPVSAPRLVAWSPEVAALVGFSADDAGGQWFADVFGGNALLPGMQPYAACYGGHQFGNWAGQLGDGRAITLGEVVNAAGERWELQLKGAGPTPYSRTADGRAVLRSSIREFLCSEAMHHLGVPTTRALSLVATGDDVVRDMFYDGHPRPEPGAIVCRVAPSFVRFGNFEIFAARQDRANLERLVDFTIDRDFPHLEGTTPEKRVAWITEVCERTARMVAHWMRVGFVHGVMNTDNMSILGLTIDYGPYGWLDDFDPTWTPNTTDAGGRRYRYGNQPAIAQWNLVRLLEAVAVLFEQVEPLQAAADRFADVFTDAYQGMMAAKFGLDATDEDAMTLVQDGFTLLYEAEVDFTLFFRALADVDAVPDDDAGAVALLGDAFYDDAKRATHTGAMAAWLRRRAARLARDGAGPEAHARRRARMHAVNPRFILRNYVAQEAIELAERGAYSRVTELLDACRRPYDDRPEVEKYARRRPEWARVKPGSSMLSCSS